MSERNKIDALVHAVEMRSDLKFIRLGTVHSSTEAAHAAHQTSICRVARSDRGRFHRPRRYGDGEWQSLFRPLSGRQARPETRYFSAQNSSVSINWSPNPPSK